MTEQVGGRYPFPPPRFLSEQARMALMGVHPDYPDYPSTPDPDAWDKWVATADAELAHLPILERIHPATTAQPGTIAGVSVVRAFPALRQFSPRHVVLDIRGGALIYMSGAFTAPMARLAADMTGASVIGVDYRKPPSHPFPAGLDDCVAVYRELIEATDPEDVVIQGGSAGANLAAALTLRARDEGLPMPRAVVLLAPELDLTESGDSFRTVAGLDYLTSFRAVNELYAANSALDDPYVSPLFADFRPGFPPTFLQSGTRDLFLSNAVRMHRALRAAGQDAELNIWDAMPHGGFTGSTPEDLEVEEAVRVFLSRFWNRNATTLEGPS